MTETDVRRCTDVDQLWAAFLDARRSGDEPRTELLRTRMADLQAQRAAQELDDDQLLAQIAKLQRRGWKGRVGLATDPPSQGPELSVLLRELARREL